MSRRASAAPASAAAGWRAVSELTQDRLADYLEEKDRDDRREVDPHPGHDRADRRQDRLRDLVEEPDQGVARVQVGKPGEQGAGDDGDGQDEYGCLDYLGDHRDGPSPSAFDFSYAATTASITAARRPPASSAFRPSAVVPPGDVTRLRRS